VGALRSVGRASRERNGLAEPIDARTVCASNGNARSCLDRTYREVASPRRRRGVR
jgi:hypothetical protein